MGHPSHHFGMHKRLTKKAKKQAVDSMAYAVGIIGNFAVIPQIIKAWTSDAPGLAVMTWALFMLIGVIWLAYAVVHRARPLIAAQIVGLTCNGLVVMGWAVNNLLKQ